MLRLVYFPTPGRAEAIRIALSLSGEEWEDVTVNGVEYRKMRDNGDLPWDMLPILQTPEGTIAESSSILRFVGHLSGFIPEKTFQIAKADEFIDAMGPLSKALDSTFGISDLDERIRIRKEVFGPEGDGTKNLVLLEKKISESKTGWAAGTDEISIADLKLFTGLFGLFSGNYDGMDASIISKYPDLIKYHDKVANEPRIKQYYDKVDSQDIRWTFLPGAFN
jgi:glutathione S-transferase